MYFPQKITHIKAGDKVLEIGPGALPHPRSNVLLEKTFWNEDEHVRQCGGTPAALTDARTVYYDGGIFPFGDGEFDYVICSHVIEHVPDVEFFCAEMFRVARSGYMEFPLIYYDFVFNIPEHLNLCIHRRGTLFYAEKAHIFSPALKPIQELWYTALASGYTDTVSDLAPYLMQGFEWTTPFDVCKTEQLEELIHERLIIPPKPPRLSLLARVQRRINRLWTTNGNL
jgi:SAM-dependent methyltransferase